MGVFCLSPHCLSLALVFWQAVLQALSRTSNMSSESIHFELLLLWSCFKISIGGMYSSMWKWRHWLFIKTHCVGDRHILANQMFQVIFGYFNHVHLEESVLLPPLNVHYTKTLKFTEIVKGNPNEWSILIFWRDTISLYGPLEWAFNRGIAIS